MVLIILAFYFEIHTKFIELVGQLPNLANSLSYKFYVALTGTSSILSGFILLCEYLYFRRNGYSFIEQMSLNHLSPWINPEDGPQNQLERPNGFECKVWQNPMNLFRGSEYERYYNVTKRKALTFYDLGLSSQDHLSFFTCESDYEKPEAKIMMEAWRERLEQTRIEAARSALQINPEHPTALILLAEEKAETVTEAEQYFLKALNSAELAFKKSLAFYNQSNNRRGESEMKRDQNVLIYIKRRLAMCARKLGRVKEAAKMFKELTKEHDQRVQWLNSSLGENLIECYLEMGDYANAQATLAKYDDIALPKSATICYTAALLKARLVSDRFSADLACRRGPTEREYAAMEAIHRAVEFNPHVPAYLLRQKSLILPPEHILKRGDSEAVAYAFHHLKHWKNVDGALNLLHSTWEGTFRMIPYPLEKGHLFYPYPSCTEIADRDLLPSFHVVSVYPKKDLPFFIVFTAALFTVTAMLAVLTHQYPDVVRSTIYSFLQMVMAPFNWISLRVTSFISDFKTLKLMFSP